MSLGHADSERLGAMLDAVAAISETPAAQGVTRWCYTPWERQAHDLFASWMTDLGLRVWTDPIGITIAEKPGLAAGAPAIGTGSHLDSVPLGGRFDGITGVVGAAEVARLLVEGEVSHAHPIRFVVFPAEEGARFGQACIASKAAGGLWTLAQLEAVKDADGVSIAQAMRDCGFSPERVSESVWSRDEWAAFLELHVEQGAVLEDQGLPIGIVDLISGSTRFELVLEGRASHTGSTPMNLRADALTAAAEVILLAEEIANDPRHHGTRCTIGRIRVEPGSMTTIPGEVHLWVDVRDIDSGRQRDTANELVRRARAITARRGVRLSPRLISDASPVVLPAWVREVVAGVCRDESVPYRVMYSGASHDTQMVGGIVAGGMIFVPSRDGLSHVPQEWTSTADIARGVDILARSILALDARLTQVGR